MNIMKLADELLLEPFCAQLKERHEECEECSGTGWATRKEDDAPVTCVMCDAKPEPRT